MASSELAEPVCLLVAEDEFLVALLLEEDLRREGFAVLGPFASLGRAREAARHERFDLAILDVNLNGEMVYPLADELAACGVPFLFLSGYEATSLPERFRAAPRLAKPYDPAALVRLIRRMVGPEQ